MAYLRFLPVLMTYPREARYLAAMANMPCTMYVLVLLCFVCCVVVLRGRDTRYARQLTSQENVNSTTNRKPTFPFFENGELRDLQLRQFSPTMRRRRLTRR